jgi:hypothetical protein
LPTISTVTGCWQQQDKCAGTGINAALKALYKVVLDAMRMVLLKIFTINQKIVLQNSTNRTESSEN